jgi:hypothetical protein
MYLFHGVVDTMVEIIMTPTSHSIDLQSLHPPRGNLLLEQESSVAIEVTIHPPMDSLPLPGVDQLVVDLVQFQAEKVADHEKNQTDSQKRLATESRGPRVSLSYDRWNLLG